MGQIPGKVSIGGGLNSMETTTKWWTCSKQLTVDWGHTPWVVYCRWQSQLSGELAPQVDCFKCRQSSTFMYGLPLLVDLVSMHALNYSLTCEGLTNSSRSTYTLSGHLYQYWYFETFWSFLLWHHLMREWLCEVSVQNSLHSSPVQEVCSLNTST